MALKNGQKIFKEIEKKRKNRRLISFFNFDRNASPQDLKGVRTGMSPDHKEPLFRVLKESKITKKGIDLCLCTRGGDINFVWPIVKLIREFDAGFEGLIPERQRG